MIDDFIFFLVPFAVVLAISLIVFALPQLGVRARIKEIKGETLKKLESEILAIGLPRNVTGLEAGPRQGVAEFITVRNMVVSYPDWPKSSSNAIRLALYL